MTATRDIEPRAAVGNSRRRNLPRQLSGIGKIVASTRHRRTALKRSATRKDNRAVRVLARRSRLWIRDGGGLALAASRPRHGGVPDLGRGKSGTLAVNDSESGLGTRDREMAPHVARATVSCYPAARDLSLTHIEHGCRDRQATSSGPRTSSSRPPGRKGRRASAPAGSGRTVTTTSRPSGSPL